MFESEAEQGQMDPKKTSIQIQETYNREVKFFLQVMLVIL